MHNLLYFAIWFETMCEAGVSKVCRFREPKTAAEEDLVDIAVPTSTKYQQKLAATIFSEWQTVQKVQVPVLDSRGMFKDYDLHYLGVLSTQIEEMDAMSLNYWLSNFVMDLISSESSLGIKVQACDPNMPYLLAVAFMNY